MNSTFPTYQKQNIFLISGMTSLATKVFFLTVAVVLAKCGFQDQIYPRPFLLYCFKNESSPLLREAGVTPCTGLLGDCFSKNNATLDNAIRIQDALEQLNDVVSTYQNLRTDIQRDNYPIEQGKAHDFFQKKLFDSSAFLDQIMQTRAELDDIVTATGAGHLQQRLRVCQENEWLIEIVLLVGLIIVIAIAVYATIRLHQKAEYEVTI